MLLCLYPSTFTDKLRPNFLFHHDPSLTFSPPSNSFVIATKINEKLLFTATPNNCVTQLISYNATFLVDGRIKIWMSSTKSAHKWITCKNPVRMHTEVKLTASAEVNCLNADWRNTRIGLSLILGIYFWLTLIIVWYNIERVLTEFCNKVQQQIWRLFYSKFYS